MGGATLLYTYDPVKVHAVKTITINGVARSFDYDANGNMRVGWDLADPLNPVQRTIVYNADNKPSQVTRGGQTTYFLYDGEGGRARKVGPGGTTYYVGEHFEIKNGEETKYIFAGNLRIAKVAPSGTYYYHKDHLGSSSAMTTDDGQVAETTNYMPFGEHRAHAGAVVTNYKYTDQEYDPETGLYYYGARYYDPVIGRFISPDSIVQDPYDPQTLNRYTYCRNSPLMYTDPNGQIAWWVPIIVGAIVGGVSAAVSDGNVLVGILSGAIGGALFAGAGAVSASLGEACVAVTAAGEAAIYGAAGLFAGAISSALSGGADGGLAALSGLVGGASGGLAGGIQSDFARFTISVASAGVVSGIMAELSGAKFSEGAIPAMVAAAATYGIGKLAKAISAKNAEMGVTTGTKSESRARRDLDLDSNSRGNDLSQYVSDSANWVTDASGQVIPTRRVIGSRGGPWGSIPLVQDENTRQYTFGFQNAKTTDSSTTRAIMKFVKDASQGISAIIRVFLYPRTPIPIYVPLGPSSAEAHP